MKKRILPLIMVCAIGFNLLTACSKTSTTEPAKSTQPAQSQAPAPAPKAAEPLKLKLGLTMAKGTVEVKAAEKFAEVVKELSKGQITADVLSGGLGGGEREIVEGQQLGTMDMSVVSGILQNFDPAMMILEYDLLFKSEEHLKKVFNGPVGEKIYKRLIDKAGVRVLGMFMRTPRLVTTNKAINSVADMKGLKIRVPEMPARVALWKALGASPTPMAFPEVFTGLQTKTIDGQENPISAIYSARFHEVVDYLAITNHVYGFMFLNISETTYKKLNDEQKKWVNEAAAKAVEYNDKLVVESEKELMDKVTAEMTVTKPDTSTWRDLTKDVYKQFTKVEGFEEIYLEIVKAGEGL